MDGIVCCCLPASKASSTDHIIPLLPECFSVVSLQVGNWKENVLHGNAVREEVVFSTKNTNVKGGHFLFVCLQRAYLLVFNYQLKRNQARWVLFWPESNSSSTLIAGTSAFSSYLYRHWRLFFFSRRIHRCHYSSLRLTDYSLPRSGPEPQGATPTLNVTRRIPLISEGNALPLKEERLCCTTLFPLCFFIDCDYQVMCVVFVLDMEIDR